MTLANFAGRIQSPYFIWQKYIWWETDFEYERMINDHPNLRLMQNARILDFQLIEYWQNFREYEEP